MRDLPQDVLRRVHKRIRSLSQDPCARGAKKLSGGMGFRAAVGAYRILYTVDDEAKRLDIVAVRHRREAYR